MGWHTADIGRHNGQPETHDAQENPLSLGIAVATEAIARVLPVFNSLQELEPYKTNPIFAAFCTQGLVRPHHNGKTVEKRFKAPGGHCWW